MNDKEMIGVLSAAEAEIGSLRREIARLAPKAEAYDLVLAIAGFLPAPIRGESVDIGWMLRKHIGELTDAMQSDRAAAEVAKEV